MTSRGHFQPQPFCEDKKQWKPPKNYLSSIEVQTEHFRAAIGLSPCPNNGIMILSTRSFVVRGVCSNHHRQWNPSSEKWETSTHLLHCYCVTAKLFNTPYHNNYLFPPPKRLTLQALPFLNPFLWKETISKAYWSRCSMPAVSKVEDLLLVDVILLKQPISIAV